MNDTTLIESLRDSLREAANCWHELNDRSWDALEHGDIDTQNSVDTEKLTQRMLVSFAWTQLKNMGIDEEWPIA